MYDLPFVDGSFSVTLASKLFQHLEAWQRAIAEIIRVTAPGGSLVLLQDRGRFRNDVRRRFEQLADATGAERYLGAHDIAVVASHLASLGSSRRTLPSDDLTWTETVRYGDALADFEQRLYAEFWSIPDPQYGQMIEDVRAWIEGLPQSVDTNQIMHAQMVIDVFNVPGR